MANRADEVRSEKFLLKNSRRNSKQPLQKHVLFHEKIPKIDLAQVHRLLHMQKITMPEELLPLLSTGHKVRVVLQLQRLQQHGGAVREARKGAERTVAAVHDV
jgi:hypothetical protein